MGDSSLPTRVLPDRNDSIRMMLTTMGISFAEVKALVEGGPPPPVPARLLRRRRKPSRFEPDDPKLVMPGWVYFVRAAHLDLIKIGYSRDNPDQRFNDFKVGCPDRLERAGVIVGDQLTERRLHLRFAHLHSHGEWFRAAPDLLKYIRRKAQSWPEPETAPPAFPRQTWLERQRQEFEKLARHAAFVIRRDELRAARQAKSAR